MNMTRNRLIAVALGIGLLAVIVLVLIGLQTRTIEYPAPPRIESSVQHDIAPSVIVTRATAPIGMVDAKLEAALPITLVTIDKPIEECVPRETVSVLGRDLFKTPKVGCRLVGKVTRGAIALSGSGRMLRAAMPINARIEIRDLGNLVKRETVTAAADVDVSAALQVAPDWSIDPDVSLAYRWRTEPGLDIAGQRITFTKVADAEIAKSLEKVECLIEAEIRRVDLRSEIAKVWVDAHDSVSVNRENPPVWLTITPQALGAGALSVTGSHVAVELMLRAGLDLIIGDRPDPAKPGPLGGNAGVPRDPGFALNVPVLADYREVEPALLKALQKISQKELIGDDGAGISAQFEEVTLYGTEGGRIAVGVKASVAPNGFFEGQYWARAGGTIWLTGRPVTAPGSERVRIEDLAIYGDMDRNVGDLLIGLIGQSEVRAVIEDALVNDFHKDYAEIVGKARRALRSVKVGPARLSFGIERFEHGAITATGAGLYMPVTASGTITTTVGQ